MMTMKTTAMFRLGERASGHLSAGREYVFEATDGTRVKIGYVAGGGFVRVEQRNPGGRLIDTRTLPDGEQAIRLFREYASLAAAITGPSSSWPQARLVRGVRDAVLALEAQIPPFGAIEPLEAPQVKALRELVRDLLAKLDTPE
jgi:hypothetical protein